MTKQCSDRTLIGNRCEADALPNIHQCERHAHWWPREPQPVPPPDYSEAPWLAPLPASFWEPLPWLRGAGA